ncbi:NAD(P)-binding protein [Stipitochalara longipes BDJ]|nr:NAD(P)-binding protein [Stipitochalara longipes BDJ]
MRSSLRSIETVTNAPSLKNSEKGSGKTVLITGCSEGGIGSALAFAFHKHGCRVFATVRNLEKVQHLKEAGIEVLELDVLDEGSCRKAAGWVREATGGTLNVLVNNSGVGYIMPLLDSNVAEVKRVYETNVLGIILTVQAFAPLLIAAASKPPSEGGGMIINIGSIAGVCPVPWASIYNSSKAAVNCLTDTLRVEMEPLRVKIILAITGLVKTHFLQNLHTTPCLPDASVYSPAKTVINPWMTGKKADDVALDVEIYAEEFVKNALRKRPKARYWSAVNSTSVWAVERILGGGTIWDAIFRRRLGLGAVKKMLSAASSKKEI